MSKILDSVCGGYKQKYVLVFDSVSYKFTGLIYFPKCKFLLKLSNIQTE